MSIGTPTGHWATSLEYVIFHNPRVQNSINTGIILQYYNVIGKIALV